MKPLAGCTALVTGGARGIGAAIAEALTKAGASVMIGDILADLGKEPQAVLQEQRQDWLRGAERHRMTRHGKRLSQHHRHARWLRYLDQHAGIEITSLVVDLKAEDLRRMCRRQHRRTALGMKHAFRAMRPGGGAGAAAPSSTSPRSRLRSVPAIAGYSAPNRRLTDDAGRRDGSGQAG